MTHRFSNVCSAASLATAVLLAAGSLLASVDTVSGDVAFVDAPPSVMPTASINAEFIFAFREKRDVPVQADTPVDAVPGDVVDPTHPLPSTAVSLALGTCVSSYYLLFEPGAAGSASGSLRFDESETVLGVELTADSLQTTNVLGKPRTQYPSSQDCLGFSDGDCAPEVSEADRVVVEEHEVSFDLHATEPGDRLRIITTGNPAGC